MDEYVIPIFLASFGGVALTLGMWFVRARTHDTVVTLFGSWARAKNPIVYWFWTIYHVAGTAAFMIAFAAVMIYFVLLG